MVATETYDAKIAVVQDFTNVINGDKLRFYGKANTSGLYITPAEVSDIKINYSIQII